jgi:hypothetical protein
MTEFSAKRNFSFWIPAKLGVVGKQLELKENKFNTEQECEEWIEKNIWQYEDEASERNKWYAKNYSFYLV